MKFKNKKLVFRVILFISIFAKLNSFGYGTSDTIFVKDLGISKVKNISSFGKDLYFRKNDSLFILSNNNGKFLKKVSKNYSEVFYNNEKKEIGIKNLPIIPFKKEEINQLKGLLPGRSTQPITSTRIGSKLYICFNGRILEYKINDFYKLHFLNKSVRSILVSEKNIFIGTYSGVYKTNLDLSNPIKINNIEYTSGYINKINGKIYFNQDDLREWSDKSNSASIINSAIDGNRFRKIITGNKKNFCLKTNSIEEFIIDNNSYKKIKTLPVRFKPTDLEFDRDVFYSNDSGEIVGPQKIIKLSKNKIIEFDITEKFILAITLNELFIISKHDFKLIKEYKFDYDLFEIVEYKNSIILLTKSGLKIIKNNKIYSIIDNLEFNSKAEFINKGTAFFGTINGLIEINLDVLEEFIIPNLDYEKITNLINEEKSKTNNFLIFTIILLLLLISIFLIKKNNFELNNKGNIKNEFTLEFISKIFENGEIKNVNQLADYFKISRVTLNKKFKEFNTTPIEFIKNLKSEKIFKLYFNEKMSPKLIAKKVGYSETMVKNILKKNN